MLATSLAAAQDGGGYLSSGGSAANVTLGQQIATSGIANNRQLHQSEIDWIRGNANDFSQWMCDAHDVCDLSEAQAAGILSGETLSGVSDSFTAYGAGANPIYHAEARDYIAKNYGGATIVDGQTMFGQVEGSREYYNTALNAHTVFSAPELYYLADLQTPGVGAQGSVFTSFLDQVGYDIHTGDFSNTRTDFQAALNTNQHNASLIFNHYGSQAPHDNPAAWVSYARDGLIGMIAADPVNADILNAFSEGGHFNPDTVAVDFGNATFAGMLNETAIGFFETKAENLLIGEMPSSTPVVRHPATNNVVRQYPDGTFSVSDFAGYPAGVPRPPAGTTYRLLSGAEYADARRLANNANAQLRRSGVVPAGHEIHEIVPVKYGGSPTDPANKVYLPAGTHRSEVTPWWNRLQRDLER